MRRKWKGGVWWVEPFAGPGQLYERETQQYLPGSPVDAVTIPRPFDGYIFVDLNVSCLESLGRRVGKPNVHNSPRDANSVAIHEQVAGIVPPGALVEVYADPQGLDFFWPSLRFFVDRYRSFDLVINLPVSGAARALGRGYGQRVGSVVG